MELKIKYNIEKFNREFKKHPRKLAKAGHDIVDAGVKTLELEGKEAVTSGPTRALKSGNLRKEIEGRMTGALEGIVDAKAPYSIYVHQGTRYMRARPFFDVAIKKGDKKIMRSADLIIKRALK